MGSFTFQNMKFHYESDGQGIPLLFLHGLGGDLTQCQAMLENVRNVRKIFMDVRGHGQTQLGPEERLHFKQFAEDANALMQHLEIREFITGGISMGSGIAINLALSFPECIGGLILIRPAWLNAPWPENLKEHVMIGKLLKAHPLERARRSFLDSHEYAFLQSSAPAAARSLLGQFDSPRAMECAARLIHIPGSVPFPELSDLAKIQVNTLILATDHDPVHPLAMAEKLASRIPGSRFAKVVSKSEDIDKHFSQCRQHINSFITSIQGT